MKLCEKAFPLIICSIVLGGCEVRDPNRPGHISGVNPLEERLRAPASIARQEGIAAIILMDTSGSMKDNVADVDGQRGPKIEIARRSALDCVRQFAEYSRNNPDRKVLVGVYEFSSRDRRPSCREVVPIGPPDMDAAASAVRDLIPSGGTPIGDAMIQAKLDLDKTGMSRRHILVVSDGENNVGYSPGAVANAISLLQEEQRAAIYFIAFDVSADRFKAVKEAGGLVLSASSGNDLKQTLDFVLTGKILVEQPVAPAGR